MRHAYNIVSAGELQPFQGRSAGQILFAHNLPHRCPPIGVMEQEVTAPLHSEVLFSDVNGTDVLVTSHVQSHIALVALNPTLAFEPTGVLPCLFGMDTHHSLVFLTEKSQITGFLSCFIHIDTSSHWQPPVDLLHINHMGDG